MEFSSLLIEWYLENGRDLPWRNTSNPYHIWVSEVILQQTRVAQGMDYYLRFIGELPTVRDLAEADEDRVLKLWQGLGYYTRARNLQRGAKWVMERHKGQLPHLYNELLQVPGLGPYSAGAIASFAFNAEVPAIDGNVYRIISRIFGVFDSPHTSKGKRVFTQIVQELIPSGKAATFNQALLDFGALQCVPQSPSCSSCPFNAICYAYRNNMVASLPVKASKLNVINRYFNFIVIESKGFTYMSKRSAKDIWHSLYEFPLIETETELTTEQLIGLPQWSKLVGKQGFYIRHISPQITHKLSHRTLKVRFVIVAIHNTNAFLSRNYTRYRIDELEALSVPVVIEKFMAAEPFERYVVKSR